MSESIESRLWPVPLSVVIAAVIVGVVLPRVDVLIDSELPSAVDSAVFNGGADTARSVLSSIAGSLITATSLTFSLTVVALQLASSQASPRVLRLFAADRQVHWTLATFLGTFAYSITVLRSVRSSTEEIPEFVPRISVTLGFVLTLASVVTLVFFLAHLAKQLRVETMLKDIHAETDRTIDLVSERYAAAAAFSHAVPEPLAKQTVASVSSGFITAHGLDDLLHLAAEHGIVVSEIRRVGDNVVAGSPLAYWWHPLCADDRVDRAAVDKAVRAAYTIGYERTTAEDVDYGVQQILDIGLRALSAGVNDPTTAVHALGHLSAITSRRMRMARLPARLAGDSGELAVVTAAPSAADDVRAALSPMRHYCADHPAVVIRFVEVIDELAYLCDDPEVTAELTTQLHDLARQLDGDVRDPATASELLVLTAAVQARIGS